MKPYIEPAAATLSADIFNIQKFSIHDGPGIRTVVFFKGCPLKCPWCSNPESQHQQAELLWDADQCRRCRLCVTHCPAGCLTFEAKPCGERLHFTAASCISCRTCVTQCPDKALDFAGKRMTVDEVMEEVLKDRDFYEESGGGITLSGGEVLAQPEFADALLSACKERSLSTALETTGYAPPEVFDRVMAHTDLLLFDMKHHEELAHIHWTGVSQEPILTNLDRAIAGGIPVIIRIPVIPGVNDSPADAQAFAKLLKEHHAKRVNLLPFHQFGQKKYEELHREYRFQDVQALHAEDLEQYADLMRQSGLDVTL